MKIPNISPGCLAQTMNVAASSITLIGKVDDLRIKARKKVGKFRRIQFATNVLKKKQALLLLYK